VIHSFTLRPELAAACRTLANRSSSVRQVT
jgi:hypothetical protein